LLTEQSSSARSPNYTGANDPCWGYAIFVIFEILVSVSKISKQSLSLVFSAASATLSIAGGHLADFFDHLLRGLALAIFAGTTFIGSIVGGKNHGELPGKALEGLDYHDHGCGL
jgi:hypothetical protein